MLKKILFLLLFTLLPQQHAWSRESDELQAIAALIFQNECASRKQCLTSWNQGEAFASLGIGHFIWYPASSVDRHFEESFPALIGFMQQHGATLPAWLADHPQQPNPWENRAHFLQDINGERLTLLRQFLMNHRALQAEFMAQRLQQSLPKILHGLPARQVDHITTQFEHVANAPMGRYVLMDYVNFKGEGSNPKERYQGKGWGLLQVLACMDSRTSGVETVRMFSSCANRVLTQRVKLSPPKRHEIRWLPGWRKRLMTYIHEAEQHRESH